MSEPLSRDECERLCFDGNMTLEDAYERVVPSLLTRVAELEKERDELGRKLRNALLPSVEHVQTIYGMAREAERAVRAEAGLAAAQEQETE